MKDGVYIVRDGKFYLIGRMDTYYSITISRECHPGPDPNDGFLQYEPINRVQIIADLLAPWEDR